MRIPTYPEWKRDTYLLMGNRGGEIGQIDYWIKSYHADQLASNRRKLLKIMEAISAFKTAKNRKYGDYKKSKRYRKDAQWNIDSLARAVTHISRRHPANAQQIKVRQVCSALKNIKMADVDFSPGVRAAAKKKMFNGESTYDLAKNTWESGLGQTPMPIFSGGRGPLKTPVVEHDHSMKNAKTMADIHHNGLIALADLEKIARVVKKWEWAVCESITATVMVECHKANIGCHMEWIGITYNKKKKMGHSIAVFDRIGDVNDPKTWGDNCYIVDMWYYQLGMRPDYLYVGKGCRDFIDKEILKHQGVKLMAQL